MCVDKTCEGMVKCDNALLGGLALSMGSVVVMFILGYMLTAAINGGRYVYGLFF